MHFPLIIGLSGIEAGLAMSATTSAGKTEVCSPHHPGPDLGALMRESAKFIAEYRWVWDLQVTRFFQLQWWQKIPSEWREPLLQLTVEEINRLPFGFTKDEWPATLKAYVTTSCCRELCLDRAVPGWVRERAVLLGHDVSQKMTPKKQHEVSHMAGVVQDVCHRTGCTVVLDIGSGLGYLGQVLSRQCGLMVVGLEREEDRVTAAMKRVKSSTADPLTTAETSALDSASTASTASGAPTPASATAVQCSKFPEALKATPRGQVSACHLSVQLNVTDSRESKAKVAALLDELQCHCGCSVKVCVVGLHCCGDLTPAVLSLFASCVHPALSVLVLVSCCYHKLSVSDTEAGPQFHSFPLSGHLRSVLASHCQLNVFALRLAAQETRARWRELSAREHSDHEKSVAFRGMLQAVCGDDEQPSRKVMKTKNSGSSFEHYAETIATQQNNLGLKRRLLQYYSDHSQHTAFIEPFTALQVVMQGPLESLVVADRLVFLRERGFSPQPVPLFDDLISPRNIAIVTTLPGQDIDLEN